MNALSAHWFGVTLLVGAAITVIGILRKKLTSIGWVFAAAALGLFALGGLALTGTRFDIFLIDIAVVVPDWLLLIGGVGLVILAAILLVFRRWSLVAASVLGGMICVWARSIARSGHRRGAGRNGSSRSRAALRPALVAAAARLHSCGDPRGPAVALRAWAEAEMVRHWHALRHRGGAGDGFGRAAVRAADG